jgi:uncharacterized membrane protein
MRRIDVSAILRYFALALCVGAMTGGLLVIIGFLVPRYVPEDYRIMMGAVIFLYGAYRFVVIYYRKKVDQGAD